MLREKRRHAHYKLNTRLDRKSSRGMIYENEELRLRTININAEVEKGQSDIKRLRRENEQLRREIWTLRDECDRLNKRFKIKLAADYEKSEYSARGSSGNTSVSFWCDSREISGLRCNDDDQGQSDDSDSCETCKMMENCQEENCAINDCKQQTTYQQEQKSNDKSTFQINVSNLPPAFDHLSIVSEETLSNAGESHRPDAKHMLCKTPSSELPPLTPTTPLQKLTNELIDSQAIIPPLSYFENIVHRESNTSTDYSTDAGCFPTKDYGWDHNIQSPFGIHKMIITTSQQRNLENEIPKSPKLTTFKPKILPKPTILKNSNIFKNNINEIKHPPVHENLPPISLCASTSSKQFFSAIQRTCPPLSSSSTSEQDKNFNTPDLTVTNGLATPYQRQSEPASPNSEEVSAYYEGHNLSENYHRHHHHHNYHDHDHYLHYIQTDKEAPYYEMLKCEKQLIDELTAFNVESSNFENIFDNSNDIITATKQQHYALKAEYNFIVQKLKRKRIEVSKFLSFNNNTNYNNNNNNNNNMSTNMNLLKLSKPIYATASNRCNFLMTATTITKPLMMTSTFDPLAATTYLRKKFSVPNLITTFLPATKTKALLYNNNNNNHNNNNNNNNNLFHELTTQYYNDQDKLSQENLESLLNDIETISGDICALKMQKNQAREKLEFTKKQLIDGNYQEEKREQEDSQLLQQYKDHKKAYRSEMNLLLSFNGTNTTFLPMNTQVPTDTILRSTSLDKEYEQSSLPSMPDPMTLFPDNHSYLPVHELGAYEQHKNSSSLIREPIDMQPRKTPLLAPNKSQLFACVQNLAAKRDLFRNAPPSVIRSLDIKTNFNDQLNTNESPEISLQQTAETLFSNQFPTDKTTEQTTSTGLTAASWSDISATVAAAASDGVSVVDKNYLKSFSFSTPNSPHTLRRNSIKKCETTNDANNITEEALTEEQLNPKPVSQDISPHILSSIDNKKPQIIQKTCSRRDSDCTISSNNQHITRGSNGNGHCRMHRHHLHIHRPSIIKNNNNNNNNNILLNNSRKDSNCETGASFSDRNSNSFSRESSISFNGNTRKISISSSHKGGKIPWCGCWGNGCL